MIVKIYEIDVEMDFVDLPQIGHHIFYGGDYYLINTIVWPIQSKYGVKDIAGTVVIHVKKVDKI